MEIKNKRVLVLGGWGLVGIAICRKLIEEDPEEIIVSSLEERQAKEACEMLRAFSNGRIRITPTWGDIFLRDTLQGKSRRDILNDPASREILFRDILEDLSEDILEHSYLYQIITRFRPHVIIDAVNSATAVAYQDLYATYFKLKKHLEKARETKQYSDALVDEVERLLSTLYVPQLIRHVQVLYEAMRRVKTQAYLKIGTSGTGGMGLNIPYTHSEERPSRVLLSKSSIAGAHTLLLFLMARTPGAPITKEIKPTAVIAWKKIEFGEVCRGGQPIRLYDCPPERATPLGGRLSLRGQGNWVELKGKTLKSVYIDTGENGIFSLGEFAAITAPGQMEFVTPEEIAKNVVYEIKGGNTGHDIINALDNATMGPTYRAGVLRHSALSTMHELIQQHGVESVAFEVLGPPRLSKLLYEAHILRVLCGTMSALREAEDQDLARRAEDLLKQNQSLRAAIISIGIPILLPDGQVLLRGPEIKIPPFRGEDEVDVTPENIDRWAHDGWVDLRPTNMRRWKNRVEKIFEEIRSIPENDTSSHYDRDRRFWLEDAAINPGKVVGWIFSTEEQGFRTKE